MSHYWIIDKVARICVFGGQVVMAEGNEAGRKMR